ncbi:LolA family protein [Yoonia sediminilitoris]|uniref:Outer membrane lipoprotein-sorting protein n=1 Tax=Yoonia sediminilitoris TaxID=1286148 RepID=A0A2T6KKH3_9RHOB|nr:outer membrane lipoprotein carrier protein LolA [Yoonia sediminilitoris]PUB16456.1 outer membrane lipoprotein-sorting protein [Yoonia sediminilitoris]RCW96805.1 outer membrane lipoprotein-sorting protein [Yoonia sediminilitoris]
MTKRIVSFALAIFFILQSGAATAQQLSLGQISGYLNQLRTAEAGFTQINSDGTLSTGTVYIKRPGRIRFEYNPPDKSLVIGQGGVLAIFDPRSNTGPEKMQLNLTPLGLILRENVDLTRERMVTNQTSDGTTTTITAQDPDHPEYGNIQLVFTANPVELRQWIVTDDLGQQTTVIMNDLRAGGSISDLLFNLTRAEREWNP